MQTIRNGVFETNSSSTHAISIDSDAKVLKQTIELDKDDAIRLEYYSLETEMNDVRIKINYCLQACCGKKDYDMLVEVIKEHTKAKDIVITNYKVPTGKYNLCRDAEETEDEDEEYGSDYENASGELLFKNKENLKKFLFSSSSYIYVGYDG